jgi:hypothetical protein
MPPILYDARGNVISSEGGRGSFSYADTSVYGARQVRGFYVSKPVRIDNTTGEVIWGPPEPTTELIVPGGGGGAKAPGRRQFGSKAQGYSPRGLVLIRLLKVE